MSTEKPSSVILYNIAAALIILLTAVFAPVPAQVIDILYLADLAAGAVLIFIMHIAAIKSDYQYTLMIVYAISSAAVFLFCVTALFTHCYSSSGMILSVIAAFLVPEHCTSAAYLTVLLVLSSALSVFLYQKLTRISSESSARFLLKNAPSEIIETDPARIRFSRIIADHFVNTAAAGNTLQNIGRTWLSAAVLLTAFCCFVPPLQDKEGLIAEASLVYVFCAGLCSLMTRIALTRGRNRLRRRS